MDEALINKHFVALQGDSVVIMRPPNRLSKKEALIFAAWIVALADFQDEFDGILKEIQEG